MTKNQIVTITIEDIGNDGEGIGKYEGYTLFVKGAVVGDVAKVKVLKVSLKKRTMLLELRGYVLTMETGICSKIKVKPI